MAENRGCLWGLVLDLWSDFAGTFWVGSISVICFICSLVMIPVGAGIVNEGNSANPESDFQALGSVCTVTGVNHCWETSGRKTNTRTDRCTDKCMFRRNSDPRPPD